MVFFAFVFRRTLWSRETYFHITISIIILNSKFIFLTLASSAFLWPFRFLKFKIIHPWFKSLFLGEDLLFLTSFFSKIEIFCWVPFHYFLEFFSPKLSIKEKISPFFKFGNLIIFLFSKYLFLNLFFFQCLDRFAVVHKYPVWMILRIFFNLTNSSPIPLIN